jgi:hypothetical protein
LTPLASKHSELLADFLHSFGCIIIKSKYGAKKTQGNLKKLVCHVPKSV